MVAKDRQNRTDSPKVEVGEIDTRAPFQSVKDAVNLFGEGAFSGEKLTIKKIKPHSTERVLVKETKLHLAQKELDKLKQQLKSAETTKSGALMELERAKRTVDDLTNKLHIVNEAKESAIKAMKKLDVEETPSNSVLNQDLENAKAQYASVFSELDAAKQELRRIRHDREVAVAARLAAVREETEAEHAGQVNMGRAGEVSKEIASVKEAIELVRLATVEAQSDQDKIHAEKNIQKVAHKTALEESAKKLLVLREQIAPRITKDLEVEFAQTSFEVEKMREKMESLRALDLDSLKTVTLELDDAKEALKKVAEEEILLKNLVESLKVELESVKKEHEELKEKEAEKEAVAGYLNVKLQKSKAELEASCLEGGSYEEMAETWRQVVAESENAKRETEEMRGEVEELRREAAAMGVALEEAERKLRAAEAEVAAAKAAEAAAAEEVKVLSERTDAARASCSGSGSKIMISKEEFEGLRSKVAEAERLAEMKVEAAAAQAEAVRASENEAKKRLEATQKEIEEMRAATEAAVKRAEMAEAAKKAVEGELRRWREREEKKAAEAASLILQETQSLPSTPVHKQSPSPKAAKAKTKKVLGSNLSGIFQRKKSQVEGGSSPSYLPGERPM